MDEFGSAEFAGRFSQFLADRLGLSEEERPHAGAWSGSGNSIGSLALRLGLLTLEQVGEVVDMQACGGVAFGEMALTLGYLTKPQVQRALQLQRLHRCLDLGGILVLQGKLEPPHLLSLIAEFFRRELGDEAD